MNTKISKTFISILAATLLVLVLILILGTVQPVHAQEVTCTVTSNADSGDGSLRAFLAEPTCDTITFAGDTTIHLASTLTLSQDVTIDGGTNNVVISGDSNGDGTGETYLFDVPSGITASFQRLTFEKGAIGKPDKTGNYRMGGAIWNAGALTVANSTFTGNSATNFGGAIYNQGSLNVTGSLFSGNSAVQGGAIYNYTNSTMAVANTTFTGNNAPSGGAILNYSGTLTITNSTIFGNSASSNGYGGINNAGTFILKNTILANNSGGNCNPSMTGDSIGNLYDDFHCVPPGSTYSSSPLLGPLGNYGGNTQTIPLLPGSPAIDAGDSAACPAADQRGVARPQGAGCDIGAFESQGFSLTATSGSNQLAALGTAFANPLVATVSSASGEPVDGGKVIFIVPQDGPGAIYQGGMGTITGGQVYAMLNANDIQGGYTVTAKIRGAAGIPGADFFLVNGCLPDPVVTNAADSGLGSLRQAIAWACPDSTITFAGDTTIHLASTLTLSQNVTIDGGTHQVVISGDSNNDGTGDVQVFHVNSGVSAALRNLTVTKGSAGKGGAIENIGTLAVNNCIFSGNLATNRINTGGGAITNVGHMTVNESTFSGNSSNSVGGAIDNNGSATNAWAAITNSTFSGNSAGSGGGIFNGATMTVTNSTFSGNSASNLGGGFYIDGTLTVTNSTLSGNHASSGGGIYIEYGTTIFYNSLIANSTGGNCNESVNYQSSSNLADDTSCGFINSSTIRLGTLGDYGGSTQTIPLLPGSNAFNRASISTCPATDQRGMARVGNCDIGAFESQGFSLAVSGGDNQTALPGAAYTIPLEVTVSSAYAEPVDGGAVSFLAPTTGASATITGNPATITGGKASVTATANSDFGSYNVRASMFGLPSTSFSLENACGSALSVTNADDSGTGSLREAIALACPGGTITFAGDTTIHLASTLTLSQDVTIDGGTHQVVLSGDSNNDGTGDVQIFYVNSGVSAALQNLTMTKGSAARGGAIFNYGTLTANNCNFSDNRATDLLFPGGGGINNYGIATVTNSTFSGNSASREGGGIANNYYASVSITNSTFSGNSTSTDGGGIYNYSGTLTVMNSTFTGNSAHGEGGAIAGTVTVTGSTFANNSATNGGGISSEVGTVTNSTFSGNSASSNGGGIYTTYGNLTVTNSTLSGNRASSGGGIYTTLSNIIFYNSLIANSTGSNCNENVYYQSYSNLADDASCGPKFTNSSTIRLGTLGDYGGATQTIPLLPGSNAFNRASISTCPATDQRGMARVGNCDIGAFESQGFSLAVSGGDNQTALPGAAYTIPLEVTVSSAYAEPVDGGAVSFFAPTTGASATITGSPATITGGKASVTAIANSTPGAYSVTANVAGATSTSFSLTNTQPTIDTTPPVITPTIEGTLGQNGWYTSDVTLSWTVIDNELAVTSQTGCDPATITSDQPETSYTCSATSAGGTNSITATIKRDATSPVVVVTGVTGGSTYILGAVPAAGCSTTDAISDVGTNATLNLTGGNTLGVGSFSATCSGAKDNAGNAAGPVSVHYNVTFQFTGFSSPVDNPSVMNIAKAGQTIPLKFRITDANGNPITNLTGVTVTAVSLSCSSGTTTDQIEEYATGNSGLQNLGDGYYQWNWKTPKSYAASCKTMKLDLGEGLFHTALFQFKK